MAAPRGSWEGLLDGIDATIRLFDKYEKEADENLDEQLEVWAHRILNRALIYCPTSEGGDWPAEVHPGFLRSTGQVLYDGQHRYRIVFGAWYAAYVHEVPPPRFHKPPTQWKFLERASEEVSLEMIREVPLGFGVRFRSIDAGGGELNQMQFVGGTGQ